MASSTKALVKERIRLARKELERGRPAAAVRPLEQALAVQPTHPEALAYYGTTLLHLGKTASAVPPLEQAAAKLGDQAWIAGNLAEAYFRAGRPEDAHRSFLAANHLDPANLTFRLGVANCMALLGRHDEAASALEALLRMHPEDPLLWYNLGNVRRDQRRMRDAIQCFGLALEAAPDWVDARNSLGSAFHSAFQFDDAEREYRRCIEQAPEHMEFRINLLSVLIDQGAAAAAEELGRDIVARWPDSDMAHVMLSSALVQQGKVAQALEHDRRAAEITPHDPHRIAHHAATLAQLGQYDAAWPLFEQAISFPEYTAAARHIRFGALHACGRLAESWADYTYRMNDADFELRFPGRSRRTELPDSSGPAAGSLVSLVHEQGLGDELFFLRFARLLGAPGTAVCYFSSGKLRSLLRDAEPVATIVDNPPAELGAPLMSIGDLPHALIRAGLLTHDPASAQAYPLPLQLRPDATRLEAMRQRLAASGPPPYLAITWSGGVPPKDQKQDWTLHKAVDAERLGRTLRALPGTLLSVQRIPNPTEAASLARAAGRTLHDYSELNDALDDMLALLALLDEYVGVSNTNMHIRAGIGKPARVLVPAPAEWRWPGPGPRSPWFPDFVCYRQTNEGDWAPALQALERDLAAALTGR